MINWRYVPTNTTFDATMIDESRIACAIPNQTRVRSHGRVRILEHRLRFRRAVYGGVLFAAVGQMAQGDVAIEHVDGQKDRKASNDSSVVFEMLDKYHFKYAHTYNEGAKQRAMQTACENDYEQLSKKRAEVEYVPAAGEASSVVETVEAPAFAAVQQCTERAKEIDTWDPKINFSNAIDFGVRNFRIYKFERTAPVTQSILVLYAETEGGAGNYEYADPDFCARRLLLYLPDVPGVASKERILRTSAIIKLETDYYVVAVTGRIAARQHIERLPEIALSIAKVSWQPDYQYTDSDVCEFEVAQ